MSTPIQIFVDLVVCVVIAGVLVELVLGKPAALDVAQRVGLGATLAGLALLLIATVHKSPAAMPSTPVEPAPAAKTATPTQPSQRSDAQVHSGDRGAGVVGIGDKGPGVVGVGGDGGPGVYGEGAPGAAGVVGRGGAGGPGVVGIGGPNAPGVVGKGGGSAQLESKRPMPSLEDLQSQLHQGRAVIDDSYRSCSDPVAYSRAKRAVAAWESLVEGQLKKISGALPLHFTEDRIPSAMGREGCPVADMSLYAKWEQELVNLKQIVRRLASEGHH